MKYNNNNNNSNNTITTTTTTYSANLFHTRPEQEWVLESWETKLEHHICAVLSHFDHTALQYSGEIKQAPIVISIHYRHDEFHVGGYLHAAFDCCEVNMEESEKPVVDRNQTQTSLKHWIPPHKATYIGWLFWQKKSLVRQFGVGGHFHPFRPLFTVITWFCSYQNGVTMQKERH